LVRVVSEMRDAVVAIARAIGEKVARSVISSSRSSARAQRSTANALLAVI
jgi:hypothetical protein